MLSGDLSGDQCLAILWPKVPLTTPLKRTNWFACDCIPAAQSKREKYLGRMCSSPPIVFKSPVILSGHWHAPLPPSEYSATVLARWSWIELRTKRESLLQVLDEDANFRGQPAAGRPYGKDWHCSLKGIQKTDDGTFSEFCGEEPCWCLGNPQMFK